MKSHFREARFLFLLHVDVHVRQAILAYYLGMYFGSDALVAHLVEN